MNYYSLDTFNTLTLTQLVKIPGINLELPKNIFTSKELLPPKIGYGWRLVKGKPELLADLRGTIYNTTNAEPSEWQELGSIPKNHTLLKPEAGQLWDGKKWDYSLTEKVATLYQQKQAELDSELATRSAFFYSNVTGTTYRYSADNEAQLNLTGLVIAAAAYPYICWEGEQRIYLEHSSDQLKQLGQAMTVYKAELIGTHADLSNKLLALKNAKDLTAMEQVVWPSK